MLLRYVLSRTIQRFLSTYLEDLDVENISVPSLFGQEWSGGLQLSNLRLKRGAKLYSKDVDIRVVSNDDDDHNPPQNRLIKKQLLVTTGEGGTIGNLTVSLCGSDIFVSIENTVITVEIRPMEIEIDEEDLDHNVMNSDDASGEVSYAEDGGIEQTNSGTLSSSNNSTISSGNSLFKILAGLELKLEDIRVKLVIFNNDTDQDESKATILELGVRNFTFVTESWPATDDFPAANNAGNGQPVMSDNKIMSNIYNDAASKFLRKRVYIGGGDIGVWIKVIQVATMPSSAAGADDTNEKASTCDTADEGAVFQLSASNHHQQHRWNDNVRKTEHVWAQHHWDSLRLFQCSEVDAIIQLYVNDNEEDFSADDDGYYDYEQPEPEIESALFGVSIAPPVASSDPFYIYDDPLLPNVETLPICSCFHRISRGHRRRVMPGSNTLGDDPSSWGYTEIDKHPMDSQMPLPGMVIHLSALVPVEFNVCRRSLEAIGNLNSLLSSSGSDNRREDDCSVPSSCESTSVDENDGVDDDDDSLASPASCSQSLSGADDGDKTARLVHVCDPAIFKGIHRQNKPHRQVRFDGIGEKGMESSSSLDAMSFFPDYMQPGNVSVVGLNLAKVLLRVHIMTDGPRRFERGYGFKFFELAAKSIAVDMHKLSANELSFVDARVDVGRCELHAYKGVDRQPILAAGFAYPPDKALSQPITRQFAAAKILDVTPLALSVGPQNSALQLCFMSFSETEDARAGGCIEVKLGAFDAHILEDTFGDIGRTIHQSKATISGGERQPSNKQSKKKIHVGKRDTKLNTDDDFSNAEDDDWGCMLVTDGGTLNWKDYIFLDIPFTHLERKSLPTNSLLEWVSDRVRLEWGRSSVIAPPAQKRPSLVSLPKNVRMIILLFLDDVSPLERALKIKKGRNEFLRAHSINRRLSKLATSRSDSTLDREEQLSLERRIEKGRRRELLTRLMSLDSITLEKMLMHHNGSTLASIRDNDDQQVVRKNSSIH